MEVGEFVLTGLPVGPEVVEGVAVDCVGSVDGKKVVGVADGNLVETKVGVVVGFKVGPVE